MTVINTNINAMISANTLNENQDALGESLKKLSTGSKLVNASDDAAGLAESIELDALIGQTNAAAGNVVNANSFEKTQDGYLDQVGKALNQMAALSVQAQDVTKSSAQLSNYQATFSSLASFITSTSTQSFNGVSLFGGASLSVTTNGSGDTFTMTGINLGATAYTNATAANISTSSGAASALSSVTAAITQLASDRATVGANETRLNSTQAQLVALGTNLTATNSQIKDVDVAAESTNFAKFQVLVQSSTAMLAQANQAPNSVLKLLQG